MRRRRLSSIVCAVLLLAASLAGPAWPARADATPQDKIDPALQVRMAADPHAVLPIIVEMQEPAAPFVGTPNVDRANQALDLLSQHRRRRQHRRRPRPRRRRQLRRRRLHPPLPRLRLLRAHRRSPLRVSRARSKTSSRPGTRPKSTRTRSGRAGSPAGTSRSRYSIQVSQRIPISSLPRIASSLPSTSPISAPRVIRVGMGRTSRGSSRGTARARPANSSASLRTRISSTSGYSVEPGAVGSRPWSVGSSGSSRIRAPTGSA